MVRFSAWILIFCLFPGLAGCNRERDFQRKLQCEQYASRLLDEDARMDKAMKTPEGYAAAKLDRVFYSQSRNSCVAIESEQMYGAPRFLQALRAVDMLTHEELWYEQYDGSSPSKLLIDESNLLKSLR